MITNRASGRSAVDKSVLLGNLGGDHELLLEIFGIFAKQNGPMLAAVRDAAKRKDAAALEHSAHALKGTVGVFGARAAVEASQKLELMGRNRDLTNAEDVCGLLDSELARLGAELAELEQSLRAERRRG